MKTEIIATRGLELLGLMMIGEGVVGLAAPRRYTRFWRIGPHWMREAMDSLSENRTATCALCAVEIAAGFWLALRELDRQ